MRVKVNSEDKIVSLWFENEEANDIKNKEIDDKIEEYRKQKYKICFYQPGKEDLKKNLLDLIINNV